MYLPHPYSEYLRWYEHNADTDPLIPHSISNTWDPAKSAKKFMQRWMWEKAMYLIAVNYPDYLSLTTNHLESGTNIKKDAPWVGKLRDRLHVPLLTQTEADRLRTEMGIDYLALPPWRDIWIYNSSHQRVPTREFPSKPILALFHDNTVLPPEHILSPTYMKHGNVR